MFGKGISKNLEKGFEKCLEKEFPKQVGI